MLHKGFILVIVVLKERKSFCVIVQHCVYVRELLLSFWKQGKVKA